MNLTHPSEVRELLDQLKLRPRRALGQNFLIDANILRILLSTANLHQDDHVLEIGPGLGVVTEWLLRWSGRVTAIEVDPTLAAHLRRRFADEPRLTLIEADALDVNVKDLLAGGVNKVVANLPYSIGSRFMVNLVMASSAPERIVVTVQREVADRLTAAPGTKDYGLLGILAQQRYTVRRRKDVSPTCFLPAPEVRSAIVDMKRNETNRLATEERPLFLDLLQYAFSRRRKQLLPTLKGYAGRSEEALAPLFARWKIKPQARPEDLSPVQWVEVCRDVRAKTA